MTWWLLLSTRWLLIEIKSVALIQQHRPKVLAALSLAGQVVVFLDMPHHPLTLVHTLVNLELSSTRQHEVVQLLRMLGVLLLELLADHTQVVRHGPLETLVHNLANLPLVRLLAEQLSLRLRSRRKVRAARVPRCLAQRSVGHAIIGLRGKALQVLTLIERLLHGVQSIEEVILLRTHLLALVELRVVVLEMGLRALLVTVLLRLRLVQILLLGILYVFLLEGKREILIAVFPGDCFLQEVRPAIVDPPVEQTQVLPLIHFFSLVLEVFLGKRVVPRLLNCSLGLDLHGGVIFSLVVLIQNSVLSEVLLLVVLGGAFLGLGLLARKILEELKLVLFALFKTILQEKFLAVKNLRRVVSVFVLIYSVPEI